MSSKRFIIEYAKAIYHKLLEAHPYEEVKSKVTAKFDKMKNEYSIKGYVKSKVTLTNQGNSRFESIYVIDEKLVAVTSGANNTR